MDTIAVSSLAVAIVAKLLSILAAWEARNDFQRTKEVLAAIETKAAVIEQIVSANQSELLNTVRDLAIPAKPDVGDQIGVEFMKVWAQDPKKFEQMVPTLMKLAEQDGKQKSN